MRVLGDADVRRLLTPDVAIGAVREALAAHHAGGLLAPPRVEARLGGGDLVFTAGRIAGSAYGFRAYDTLPTPDSDQVTVVYDDETGRVAGVCTGDFLGAARTGAIGAVAVDVLARPDAVVLGLVGAGRQAWTQLWAISAVRALREVRVYSRDAAHRAAFAQRARSELGLRAWPAGDPRAALDGADIVVLATSSRVPVIEAGWVGSAGVHVTTLGRKSAAEHECPPELAERAEVLVTDSPAQLSGFTEPLFLPAAATGRVVPLGSLVAGSAVAGSAVASTAPARTSPDQMTFFLSVGLAGTEVAVAAALLRQAG